VALFDPPSPGLFWVPANSSKTSRIRYEYDDYGNVVSEYQDGDTSTNVDDYTIHRVYYPNTDDNILDKIAREWITDYQANTKKDTYYYYDNNESWTSPPERGNLTRLEQSESATSKINSYFTYYSNGNLQTSTDANGNSTNWTYETTFNAYPASKTNSDNSTEYNTYIWHWTEDSDAGLVKVTDTDVNGNNTVFYYDEFNRLIKIVKPGDTYAAPSIEYRYNEWSDLGQQNIETINKVSDSETLWQKEYFDGLGRVIQTHASGESGHTIISSTVIYNSRGLVEKQYVSQDIGSVLTSYQTPGAGWKYSSFAYDGLGRVITQTDPDGTYVSHDYSTAWRDLVTNQRGYKTKYYTDAFQRLATVEELNASHQLYATTTYAYDVLGNLVQVEENDGNTTNMTYDRLSRKTAMSDPDMGSWTYDYDDNGNLISQTDAMSQTITMDYDELNRLTEKEYSSANMTDISYTYDESDNGIGLRTGMVDASGNTTWRYDARGRVIEEIKSIVSDNETDTFTTRFGYDSADRLTWVFYPSGENVTQTYNGRGLPNSVNGTNEIVTGASYNALGLPTQINLGNGLRTNYSYWGIEYTDHGDNLMVGSGK
jgi:YD repeat-containing protein